MFLDSSLSKFTSTKVFTTVYEMYLAYNKFGELGRNAHWQRFQFGKQDDIEYIHVIISSVGVH